MPIYDPTAGFTGTPDPAVWARGQAAIADARAAAGGASLDIFPGADFIFVDPLTGDPKLAESLEDVATVVRASKAWSMGWDGVNGNPAGALVEHASGKSRWSPYGLQVAPSTENRLTNPRGEGAALPAVPTNWSLAAPGATITPTGRGIQDGWPYVDVTVNGTVTSTGIWSLMSTSAATAIDGDIFTGHVGLALVSGSTTAVAPQMRIGKTSGGIEGAMVAMPATSAHNRWSITRTMSGSPGFARLQLLISTGVYTNAVYRIFTPVFTKTDYITHPVLPPVGTPGSSVKAADTAITVATNLGWYRHDEGTLVVEIARPLYASSRGIVGLPDPAALTQGRGISNVSGTGIRAQAITAGPSESLSATVAIAAGRHLMALRWSGAVHKTAVDGVLGAGFTHGAVPVLPTSLYLGTGLSATGAQSATPIHRVRFFPRAMSDAEMTAITTPYWSA